MLQIKRAGHSTLTTPDIERMIDYFTRIVGLSLAAREKNRAILATKSGLEAIVLERGGAVDAPRLSFQVAPGSDLGEVASRLKKAGIKSERRTDITPGIGEAVAFTDPKGTTIEIFSDFKFAPEDNTFTGVMPIKFGHIAYQCPDVQGMVKFYCDVLGFRVSDWRRDFFAFLRCSRDHHTVNFLRDAKTAIHHIAFEVRDWSDIKRACDMLAQQRHQADLGSDPPHHRPQHRDLSQEPGRRGDRVLHRSRPDARRRARLLRAAALAPGPAAEAEGVGRRHAVELVGPDVARLAAARASLGAAGRRAGPPRPADRAARKPALAEARAKQTQKKSRGKTKPRR